MTYEEMVEIAIRNGCIITGYDGLRGNIPSRIVFGNCTLIVNYSYVSQLFTYKYIKGGRGLGFDTIDLNSKENGVEIDLEEFEKIIKDNVIMIKNFEAAKRISEAQRDFV